jgi:hypothetical protein
MIILIKVFLKAKREANCLFARSAYTIDAHSQ